MQTKCTKVLYVTYEPKVEKLGLGLGYAYHYGLCISLVYFSSGPLLLLGYSQKIVGAWLIFDQSITLIVVITIHDIHVSPM